MVVKSTIVLSRYFDGNVKFIAKKCPQSYEESDVKIFSINLAFLKKFDKGVAVQIFGSENEEKHMKRRRLIRYRIYRNSRNILSSIRVTVKHNAKKLKKLPSRHEKPLQNILCEKTTDNNESDMSAVNTNSDLDSWIHCDNFRKFEAKPTINPIEKAANIEQFQMDYQSNFHELQKELSSSYWDRCQSPCRNDVEADLIKLIEKSHRATEQDKPTISRVGLQDEYLTTLLGRTPSSWVPPRSPHNLVEELLHQDPWALLVATIFLNKTKCSTTISGLFQFLLDHRTPFDVLGKLPSELERYFVGLQRTRAVQVYRMSVDYVGKRWKSARELYGIGHYGDCAFRMFCLGDFAVEPKDRYLRIYKGWYEKVYLKGAT